MRDPKNCRCQCVFNLDVCLIMPRRIISFGIEAAVDEKNK